MAKNSKKAGDGLIRRIGNFNVYSRVDRHGNWIIVENLIKNWQIRYRDDNEMYSMLKFVLSVEDKDNVIGEYVERFIVSCFFQSAHLHDWLCMVNGGERDESGNVNYIPFLTSYWKLIDEEARRESGYVDRNKSDDEAIAETALHENLMEEVSKITIDKDGTVHER